MLLAVVVMTAIILITLAVAAPVVARDLRREREVESTHRANQYVRAIQLYYRKFGHYPGSMDDLEKSNNIRFLRQRYTDPLTGQNNWRLIHVGQNKTTPRGFFGQPLAGPMPPGLGSAAGMASNQTGATPALGAGFQGAASGATGSTGATGSSGATGSTGFGSPSGLGTLSGGGGPVMGVGSAANGDAIVAVNDKSTYQEWEFLYDPRVELMRAKASLLGGAPQGGSTGLGGSTGTTGPTSGGVSGATGAPTTNTPTNP